jgi:hypothetical protein
MSVDRSEDALQRLNYFNGERLAAADFRAEQAHHVEIRRLLNRSLFAPGIVVGLEVEPIKSSDPIDKRSVLVRSGLAFDNQGREIYLPEDVKVQVMGAPSSTPGVVFGNLLVISYRETRKFPQGGCLTAVPYRPCSGDLPWGAPKRIVADAVFEFLDSWPSADSGKVVLSQIELSASCEVVRASPGVRKYAVPAKPQSVRPLSLEGEKDIDNANPKILFFHVEGGTPEIVTLYLRGRTFSSLFYTELGRHSHGVALKTSVDKHDFTHDHQPSGGVTTDDGDHTHIFIVDAGETSGGIDLNASNGDYVQGNNPILNAGIHHHSLTGLTLSKELGEYDHSHDVKGDSNNAGATDVAARSGKPALSSFKDLIIKLDDVPITEKICDQLEAQPGQANRWKVVVSPTDIRMSGASLNTADGTGEVDLLKLGVEIGIGQHKLEFLVADADVGGNIQFNLYVS